MACINPRKYSDGTVVWRVWFRRKGIKPFSATFLTKQEAEEFSKKYEASYCLDPNFEYDQLKHRREREFS